MKKQTRIILLGLALIGVGITAEVVTHPAEAANVVKRLQGGYVFDGVQTLSGGIKVGATGTTVLNSYEGCDCPTTTTDPTAACSGTWSSRATSTSSKEDITVTGAVAGDACYVALGPTAAAAKQALAWTCEVSATNTATLHVTNASGGSLTPTTGRRCIRTVSP